jgi:hypothetical protein
LHEDNFPLPRVALSPYVPRMKWLTRQEQTVLLTLLFLILVGLGVKAYRTSTHIPQSNPPAAAR